MGSFILLFSLWNRTMLCSSFCSFCCSTSWPRVPIAACNCFFVLIALYYSIVLTFHKVFIYCQVMVVSCLGLLLVLLFCTFLNIQNFWWASVFLWFLCSLKSWNAGSECVCFPKCLSKDVIQYNLHSHQPSMKIPISPHLWHFFFHLAPLVGIQSV